MKIIAIVDYNMGNIGSLTNALKETKKCEVLITKDPAILAQADGIFLPGVGAYELAMKHLNEAKLVGPLKKLVLEKKKPLMCVCLGMQLLFEYSEEGGHFQGLGLLPGYVKKFEISSNLMVPHIGWNDLKVKNKNSRLFRDIKDGTDVYFVHSYHVVTNDDLTAATSDYDIDFCASVEKENIYATQFHPEKSQHDGLRILNNFIDTI